MIELASAGRFLEGYGSFVALYLPLGIIGAWRWGVWFVKILVGSSLYRPASGTMLATVSVVTPVYNERPEVFRRALRSWKENRPNEIIAVIDASDTASIAEFERFARESPGAALIVTDVPGKRPALADGIRRARSEIVALADSDTIWERDVRAIALAPFSDPRVGGVTTRQNVLEPVTLAQKLFDIQLDQRSVDEFPFQAVAGGGALRCLSGRTSFYRRAALLPFLDGLVNETFWGKPVISGEDKRLTYLLQAAGWRTAYQKTARVYTPGAERLTTFLRQRLRWIRNSWRADLRALGQRWTWRRPVFALYLLDNSLGSFTPLIGPITAVLSLALGLWIPALVLILWWHVTRYFRISAHLGRRPQDILLLPAFVGWSFLVAGIRIYALCSLNVQGWITRWDPERLPRIRRAQTLFASAATALIILLLVGGVLFLSHHAALAAAAAGATSLLRVPFE